MLRESHSSPGRRWAAKTVRKKRYAIFINVHGSDRLAARSRSPHFTPRFFFYQACFTSTDTPLVVSDSQTVFLLLTECLCFTRQIEHLSFICLWAYLWNFIGWLHRICFNVMLWWKSTSWNRNCTSCYLQTKELSLGLSVTDDFSKERHPVYKFAFTSASNDLDCVINYFACIFICLCVYTQ